MISKSVIVGAASACAALIALAAPVAASAQPWSAPAYGYGSGYGPGYTGYGPGYGPGYSNGYGRPDGGPVDALFQREDRMADWIRRMSYAGRLDRDESRRAWGMLADARRQTMHETREHGRYLPGHDYAEISQRLNGLERFLRHEAHEDWDD